MASDPPKICLFSVLSLLINQADLMALAYAQTDNVHGLLGFVFSVF